MGKTKGIKIQSSGSAILLNRWITYATHRFYENNKIVRTKNNYEIQWQNVKNDICGLLENPFEFAPRIAYSLLAFFFILLGKHELAYLTAFAIGAISVGTKGGTTNTSITMSTLSTTAKTIGLPGNHQGTISNVTLDGTALTFVVRAATAFNETSEIWYIDSPGELTSVSLAGTYSGGNGRTIGYVNLEGTAAGAPEVNDSATGSSSDSEVTVTPTSNDAIVIGHSYSEATQTIDDETEIFTVQGQSYQNASASYVIQSGSPSAEAMHWDLSSGQRWAACGVAIAPSSAAVKDLIQTGVIPFPR